MRLCVQIWLLLGVIVLFPSSDSYAYLNNAIVSWGDNSFVYGRGTDSAMDTPEGIARLMARWKGRGYTGVYWRTDLSWLDPNQLVYHPTGMTRHCCTAAQTGRR